MVNAAIADVVWPLLIASLLVLGGMCFWMAWITRKESRDLRLHHRSGRRNTR